MKVYLMAPRSRRDGMFAASWFDDAEATWEDVRLLGEGPLAQVWSPPPSFICRPPPGPATGVLFNPSAFAVSANIRDSLSRLRGIEFLPINVRGSGEYYILHVVSAVDIEEGVTARLAPPPSGNIVEVTGFGPEFLTPSDFFRVRNPPASAAGRRGYCDTAIFISEDATEALRSVAGEWIQFDPVPSRPSN
ncbi:MAG: hypothetical protein IPG45_07985 [Deltaproteobacteria bacterium]|nr:hypothetical protein [Deltaproteobacteria bacterium]